MKNNESESRIMSKINTLIQDVNKKTKINKNDTINISEDEDLVESENLKINLHSSGGSYKSMFSIISKDDEKEDEKEDENESAEYINKNNYKLDKSNNSNDLRRDSCISQISNISSGNNKTLSFWQMVKLKLNDIKNHLIFNYNIFSTQNTLVDISQTLSKEIQIFDIKYLKQEELLNKLKNIPWFSYRENFEQIKEDENIVYTSDAGWGCMFRASQMILAQGLFKLYNLKNLYEFINQFFAYFYDNKIPIKFMCKPQKEKQEKNNKEEDNKNIFESFEIIEKENKLFDLSFIDLSSEMIHGLENMSERKSNSEYIIPPFSIRNLIKFEKYSNKFGKKLGEWFSNYDTIRLICTINKRMNSHKDCNFKVLNFNEGVIKINEIINNCLEEFEEDKDLSDFEILSLSSIECADIVNNNLENDKYIFNKKKYIFKHKFILFVSVRHGLYTLEEDYYDEVLKVFDIETNIGMIGGKNTRAFYFIGKCGNNLIFLDPHYVQQTLTLKQIGTIDVQDTYIPNDIFYMNVEELSPSFSIGFAVNDMKNFKKLMKKLTSKDYFITKDKRNINNIYLFEVKDF
jgi:hypothetical protein